MKPVCRRLVAALTAALTAALATGCGSSCPTGRTTAENGTCVDQKVVDFVACIDHANGSERATTNGKALAAEVRTASVGVTTIADFKQSVSTKILPTTDAQGQRLLDMCNMHVFGASLAASGGGALPPGPMPNGGGGGGSPGPTPNGGGGALPPGPPNAGPPTPSAPGKASGPNCASGWSLRECEQWAVLVRNAQSQLDVLNNECKSTVEAGFVAESFRGHFDPKNSAGVDNDGLEHAVGPISAVAQICAMGDAQRAAVRSKVRRIEARWGGSGKSTWTFENGVLTGIINPTAESSFDYRAAIRGPEGLRRQL